MKNLIICLIFALMFFSCQVSPPNEYELSNENINIYPDYTNLTIPNNIAPLNFRIDDKADEYITVLSSKKKGSEITIKGKDVVFNERKWKEFLMANKGDTVLFQIFLKQGKDWVKYAAIRHFVAEEPIDRYLAYRLIQPLFVTYNELSIEQRDITNFKEKTIFNTRMTLAETHGQCVNCHSFQDYNKSGKMQVHLRGYYGGTIVTNDGKLEKVDLKTDSTISGGVYPSWHPSLNLIAYSVNKIHQNFHTRDLQKTEVQDTKSGLILYDIKNNKVRKIVDNPNSLETFPYWAPDGKTLFFASADYIPSQDDLAAEVTQNYEQIKYNLFQIPFNTQNMEFGDADTVFNAAAIGKSATFPRLSPNEKYLMFTMADYGNFHIWHKTGDLYLKNMETGETREVEELNSEDTESYHSWSSNGKWVVFSSRREDGGYTRFYISCFDGKGHFSKPFILLQKEPGFYHEFFKSYNIPEFLVEPTAFSAHDILNAIKTQGRNAEFSE